MDSRKGFNQLYSSSQCVWGLEADKYLAMFLDEAPKGRALDIGCGEGRHSLFLAQNGYTVDAVDISEKAIQRLEHLSREYEVEGLITPRVGDIRTMEVEEKYDLVIASYVFPFLRRSDIIDVVEKVKTSLSFQGCIYVSAVTVDDAEYHTYSKNQTPLEVRTFYSPGLGCCCYFFERNELRTLFSDFRIIDYREVVINLLREPFSHAMCLLFAQNVRQT